MLIKCSVCGAHVPDSAAVEPGPEHGPRYCSVRCAAVAESQSGRPAPLVEVPEMPRRLLVAVDGSGPSLRATALAVALARAGGGCIELLHAIDPSLLRLLPLDAALEGAARLGIRTDQVEKELRDDAEAQIARCRRVCEEGGVAVTSRIELAPPARAIATAAERADLVVMGSRGLGALTGVALGSLSHRVLGATRRPVLVVH